MPSSVAFLPFSLPLLPFLPAFRRAFFFFFFALPPPLFHTRARYEGLCHATLATPPMAARRCCAQDAARLQP